MTGVAVLTPRLRWRQASRGLRHASETRNVWMKFKILTIGLRVTCGLHLHEAQPIILIVFWFW